MVPSQAQGCLLEALEVFKALFVHLQESHVCFGQQCVGCSYALNNTTVFAETFPSAGHNHLN